MNKQTTIKNNETNNRQITNNTTKITEQYQKQLNK